MCRVQRAATKAAGLKAANLLRSISVLPDGVAASPDVPEQGPPMLTPKALSRAHTTVNYEFGKAFDKQDADSYFGGMRGVYTLTPGSAPHGTSTFTLFLRKASPLGC